MAMTWGPIETAVEASIADQASATIDVAVAGLVSSLGTFLASFTGTPDDDYAQVATFLSNLSAAITTAESMLTAEQVKAEIPATMSGWVTEAIEAQVAATLPSDAHGTVSGGGHDKYLPHQPE